MTTNTEVALDHQLDEPPAVLQADATGMVLDIDPRLARFLDRPVNEIVGRSALTWIHPDDIATTIAVVGAVVELAGSWCPMRVRVGGAGGRWKLVACAVENRLDDPERPGVHVHVQPSLTASIDAAGELRRRDGSSRPVEANPIAALSDSPTDCGLLLSSTTGVTFVSPLLGRLLLRPLPDLLESYGDLFHPDEQDVVVDFVDRLFTDGGRPVCATLRVARGDGSWGLFQIATANLTNDPDFNCFVTLVRALDAGEESTGTRPHRASPSQDVCRCDSPSTWRPIRCSPSVRTASSGFAKLPCRRPLRDDGRGADRQAVRIPARPGVRPGLGALARRRRALDLPASGPSGRRFGSLGRPATARRTPPRR